MNMQNTGFGSGSEVSLNPGVAAPVIDRHWFAVFATPNHEKSVLKHLDLRDIESFLPTYETFRVWKNRQRMKIVLPLFPNYLFVHINDRERLKVLQSPGVLQIVGNHREHVPLADSEVELLRSGCYGKRIEPYRDLVVGEKVRIKRGPMEGVQGTLVRCNSSFKFVLTIELINQHTAVQVDAEDLEPVLT
jgi:transcription antitermination factor NusG